MKNSLVNRLGITGIGITTILGANSLDANAQKRSEYKDLDKNGKFTGYNTNTSDVFQEKVFYNEATKKYDRFYIQHIDKNMHENDLDIAALPFYESMRIMDFKTGNASHLVSNKMYNFFPIKEKSLELTGSHVPGLCDNQIREIAGAEKGKNYVSDSYVKDYFKKLSDDMVLELENGKSFLILTLPKEKQVEGKTNQLYIPFDNKHQWGVDPKTKKLWVFGDIYQGVLETGPVMASASTGLVSKLGENDSFAESVKEAGEKEIKERKKGDLYLIFGANANDKFTEGQFGIQYGPVAIVANYGQGKDETVQSYTTDPNPLTGISNQVKVDEKNIRMGGGALELHLFNNSKIYPFIGGGINNWKYETEKTVDKIKNSVVIDTETSQTIDSELSYKAITGLNIKAGKNFKLALQAGWDSKTKTYVGFRGSKRF